MKKNNNNRERINVTFDQITYDQIKLLAGKQNVSMSELVREWAIEGLNGKLTANNIDVLAPILRSQLKSIIDPAVNRLASLSAKTCIEATTATYLTAETIHKLVPVEEREDVISVYESAKRKAIEDVKKPLSR